MCTALSPARKYTADRRQHAERPDQHEQDQGHRLVGAGRAGGSDRGRRADGEQAVLRVEGGQQSAEADRPDRRQRVDARHPLRRRRLARRPAVAAATAGRRTPATPGRAPSFSQPVQVAGPVSVEAFAGPARTSTIVPRTARPTTQPSGEQRAREPAVRGCQQQDDRHDRQRADRDTGREAEHRADRGAHVGRGHLAGGQNVDVELVALGIGQAAPEEALELAGVPRLEPGAAERLRSRPWTRPGRPRRGRDAAGSSRPCPRRPAGTRRSGRHRSASAGGTRRRRSSRPRSRRAHRTRTGRGAAGSTASMTR